LDFALNSSTTLTITLPAVAAYDISQSEEEISISIPWSSVDSGSTLTPTPSSFSIGVESGGAPSSGYVGPGMSYSRQSPNVTYDRYGKEVDR